jgi:glycerol-3-phosphate acyltransferase PlsY
MREVLSLALAYLLGTIPTAYFLSKAAGRDVRRVGSGNVGGTNVLRNVGLAAGILTVLVDAGKGALALCLARQLAGAPWVPFACMPLVIAGHNWIPWLAFKGGKGLAALAGAMLVLMPGALPPALVAMAMWTMTLKDAGMGAALTAASLPVIAWLSQGRDVLALLSGLAAGVLVFWKHLPDVKAYAAGRRQIL